MPPPIDINELASRFDYLACMLAPSTDEVYVVRTSILLEFAHPNPNPQYRDSFANGGQLVTDMAIIKHESDPYNVADFKAGFANLYGIEYHEGIRGFPKVVRIANVHADLLTMGDLGLGQMDRDRYVRLARMVLGCWERVVEYGDRDGVFGEGVPLDLEDVYWDVVYGVRG